VTPRGRAARVRATGRVPALSSLVSLSRGGLSRARSLTLSRLVRESEAKAEQKFTHHDSPPRLRAPVPV